MANYCEICHKKAYSDRCMQHKQRKPINQKGKKSLELDAWVRDVARPYLDEKYGRVCAACGGERCGNKQLDVDHIKNKGSNYHLRMVLSNVQYLGRWPCHREKTDNVNNH